MFFDFFNMILSKVIRLVLQRIFKFEVWHTSPARRRKYVRDIIEIANGAQNRDVILEIGCGLGDIVGSCDYKQRYFLDSSVEVLNAAKFLQIFNRSRSQNVFMRYKLSEDKLPLNELCDTIIMVNWIHAIESKILAESLDELTTKLLKSHGTLILDLLTSESINQINGNVYLHEIENILNLDEFDITINSGYNLGRQIIIAKKLY